MRFHQLPAQLTITEVSPDSLESSWADPRVKLLWGEGAPLEIGDVVLRLNPQVPIVMVEEPVAQRPDRDIWRKLKLDNRFRLFCSIWPVREFPASSISIPKSSMLIDASPMTPIRTNYSWLPVCQLLLTKLCGELYDRLIVHDIYDHEMHIVCTPHGWRYFGSNEMRCLTRQRSF